MSAAHDTRIEIGGDVYWVRREFDLIRRVEQAFGPLGELDAKLRRHALTAEDMVKLYGIALKAQVSRPSDDDVRAHIVDVGIREVSEQLAMLIVHLFAGHRRTVKWLEAEARKVEGEEADDPPPQAA